MGLVDGITTNPTLLSKEKGNPAREIVREIVKIVKGPVSLEVIGTTMEEIINEAHRLKKYGQNLRGQDSHGPRRIEGCQEIKSGRNPDKRHAYIFSKSSNPCYRSRCSPMSVHLLAGLTMQGRRA